MIFAVFDPSPLTVCINCSFFTCRSAVCLRVVLHNGGTEQVYYNLAVKDRIATHNTELECGPTPNVMAALPCSNAATNARLGCKVNFAILRIPLRGKSPQKCVVYQAKRPSCKVWLISVERRRCSNEGSHMQHAKPV